jgi:glyoxylase-like metal-dependent hydrolase (beta-lactamase superfamily II)
MQIKTLNKMTKLSTILVALPMIIAGSFVQANQINFNLDTEAPGNFRFRWIHGSTSLKHNTDPRIQVQRYNAHTFVMRQNRAIHWEAPFMYLLFGNDRAILIDTGATANPNYFPIREMVDGIITRWKSENNKQSIQLIVAQVSTDQAHVQGHHQFEGRPNTVFLGMELKDIQRFAALTKWPHNNGSIDLGGRSLVVIPSPGINANALTFYDPYNRWLITGDVVLPGRIWVTRWDDFKGTIARLRAFASSNKIYWVMGSNIEMSYFPGVDYRMGGYYQPTERLLQMEPSIIEKVADATEKMNGFTGIEIYDDFVLMYGVPRGARAYGYPNPVPERFKTLAPGGLR